MVNFFKFNFFTAPHHLYIYSSYNIFIYNIYLYFLMYFHYIYKLKYNVINFIFFNFHFHLKNKEKNNNSMQLSCEIIQQKYTPSVSHEGKIFLVIIVVLNFFFFHMYALGGVPMRINYMS